MACRSRAARNSSTRDAICRRTYAAPSAVTRPLPITSVHSSCSVLAWRASSRCFAVAAKPIVIWSSLSDRVLAERFVLHGDRSLGRGEDHDERAAPSRRALHADGTAMELDKALDESEPEAGAGGALAAVAPGLAELLEEQLLDL